MKKLKYGYLVLCVIFLFACGNENNTQKSATFIENGQLVSTFKVWGNCGMCKKTIESSLNIDGVSYAEWSPETKMMRVEYDSAQINLSQIQQKIASVGYDNEVFKGVDSAYTNLHECCKYDRK